MRGERDKKKKERKKEKDLRDTPKPQWWHHQYRWKDLNRTNQTTPRKVTNGNWSGPHELTKDMWALTSLDDLYDPLRSLFMTFHVIEFVSSRYFSMVHMVLSSELQCVSRVIFLFFFFVFSLSSLLLVICEERGEREK
jgi:hypothetical protein